MERRPAADAAPTQEEVIADLRARLGSLSRDNERLAREAGESARLAREAGERADALQAQLDEARTQLEHLVEMVRLANQRYWGQSSERAVPGQLSLFDGPEPEAAADPAPEQPAAGGSAGTRRRGGRRRLDTSGMERVVVEHTVGDPRCPACGGPLSEMKVETTEVVRLVPAHLEVVEHRRHVYRCPSCCAANAAGEDRKAQIMRAPMPAPSPFPGSFASPSLVAGVLHAKYALSEPLYRIEAELRSLGADVSRQDMANWVMGAAERWLSLVRDRMRGELLGKGVIHADETQVQVLREPGREAGRPSRMWLFRSAPRDVPICVYRYDETRSAGVARGFLAGWSGYLVTDGYAPYFGLGLPGVVNVACLVHVRRKFAEIVKAAGGDARCAAAGSAALEARHRIDRIFREDGRLDGLEDDRRREARLERVAPLMGSFKSWARSELPKAAPGLALEKALSYALRYWPYVENALLDGRVELDNNCAERAIRPFVVGRKNWLFSDTPRGASASAAIYSVVVTARLNGLNDRAYLEWLLSEMPNDGRLGEPGRIDRYLPWSGEVPASCRLPVAAPGRAGGAHGKA